MIRLPAKTAESCLLNPTGTIRRHFVLGRPGWRGTAAAEKAISKKSPATASSRPAADEIRVEAPASVV